MAKEPQYPPPGPRPSPPPAPPPRRGFVEGGIFRGWRKGAAQPKPYPPDWVPPHVRWDRLEARAAHAEALARALHARCKHLRLVLACEVSGSKKLHTALVEERKKVLALRKMRCPVDQGEQ